MKIIGGDFNAEWDLELELNKRVSVITPQQSELQR